MKWKIVKVYESLSSGLFDFQLSHCIKATALNSWLKTARTVSKRRPALNSKQNPSPQLPRIGRLVFLFFTSYSYTMIYHNRCLHIMYEYIVAYMYQELQVDELASLLSSAVAPPQD